MVHVRLPAGPREKVSFGSASARNPNPASAGRKAARSKVLQMGVNTYLRGDERH
jgi:hypothetical protein